MFRRNVLERTAVISTLVAGSLSGCLDSVLDETGTSGAVDTDVRCTDVDDAGTTEANRSSDSAEIELDAAAWVHETGGTVSTIADGLVLGQEDLTGEHSDGGIFALEAETGEHRWTFGSSGFYTGYTPLAVDDAIYVGFGDDAIGSGAGSLHAIEFDGTERWTKDVGSVYHRPRLVDGTVYVGSDDGVVRALEGDDGTAHWTTSLSPDAGGASNVAVAAVEDVVFVGSGPLLALDRANGDVRWQYGGPGDRIHDATVRNGIAYVTDGDRVVAIENGYRRWRTSFAHNRWIRGVAADRVVVEHQYDLHGLDAGNGDERWIVENEELTATAFHDTVLYVADGTADATLHAIDLVCGDERWTVSLDEAGPIETIQVVEDSTDADHSLYVVAAETHLHEVTADGRVVRSASLPGDPGSVVADGRERPIIGAGETVYAIPEDGW